MNLRVTVVGQVKVFSTVSEAKASLNRAFESAAVDAKPSDLPLVRLKVR